jgi:hypothetical protein
MKIVNTINNMVLIRVSWERRKEEKEQGCGGRRRKNLGGCNGV